MQCPRQSTTSKLEPFKLAASSRRLIQAAILTALLAVAAVLAWRARSEPVSDLIELYAYNGHYTLAAPPPEEHPILMEVPQQFRYASTKAAKRTWGVQLLTYYPGFASPSDPANAQYGLSCAGICNGRILVYVEYGPRLASTGSPTWGDFIARQQFKYSKTPPYPPNVAVRDIKPPASFDEGFERITTRPHTDIVALDAETLLRRGAHLEYYDLAATCTVNPARTACVLHFSLDCNPAIHVSVNGLDSSYLDRVDDIVRKTKQFVGRMVRSRYCPSQDQSLQQAPTDK